MHAQCLGKRARLYVRACAIIQRRERELDMARNGSKGGIRARIAAAAARIMAEGGIDDFALAKRKAARQLGVEVNHSLPRNDEIEAELRTYRALYQPLDHAANLVELRSAALEAMRALAHFKPYLTGPVLKGIAGPHAAIELQLFPENSKDVELFLLEHSIGYSTHQSRRFAGDRAHPVSGLTFDWNGVQFKLSVFDPRDERLALKTSVAGRALERAGIREVAALLSGEHGAPQA